jgi:hypothetical protein
MSDILPLRDRLVKLSLAWQRRYGVAPAITSAISEFDAAMLLGMEDDEYSSYMANQSAVAKGSDFVFNGTRYQVKANRPSGRSGSTVTLVPKASNYEWDYLIWILYDVHYEIIEAWSWKRDDYIAAFDSIPKVRPQHYRAGTRLK